MRSSSVALRLFLRITGGFHPVFSPEGDQIVFGCVQPATVGASAESQSKAHNDDICVMNADGSNVINVTNTPGIFENARATLVRAPINCTSREKNIV
jgi:hypothetical protein